MFGNSIQISKGLPCGRSVRFVLHNSRGQSVEILERGKKIVISVRKNFLIRAL